MAKPKISSILVLKDWQDKQDAVDELFETVEAELRGKEEVLGLHPRFGHWVEHSLEEYLRNYQHKQTKGTPSDDSQSATSDSGESVSNSVLDDEDALPIFMDCFNPDDSNPEAAVPDILNPLKPHPHDGPGRMVEEWEMSAHKTTKRILLRHCTRSIARALEENDASRVYVHGRKGVGKVCGQRI